MRAQFIKLLAEDPYDQITRLALADWLEEGGEDDAAAWHRAWTPDWERAKEWLTAFASSIQETEDDHIPSLEEVVAAGQDAYDNNTSTCLSGCGFRAEEKLYDTEFRQEFWKHWGTYTRTQVDPDVTSRRVFRCGC
jgi:uncharacterized protein (TIGR02996 family)